LKFYVSDIKKYKVMRLFGRGNRGCGRGADKECKWYPVCLTEV